MDDADQNLAVGDFCFAHVRTYPWWPARIVSSKMKKRKKVLKEIFRVVFYGTNESADLPGEELVRASSSSIKECATKAAMKRKYYLLGFKTMEQEMKLEQFQKSSSSTLENHPKRDSLENMSKQEFLLGLNLVEKPVLVEQPCNKEPHSEMKVLPSFEQALLSPPISSEKLDHPPKKQDLSLPETDPSREQVMPEPITDQVLLTPPKSGTDNVLLHDPTEKQDLPLPSVGSSRDQVTPQPAPTIELVGSSLSSSEQALLQSHTLSNSEGDEAQTDEFMSEFESPRNSRSGVETLPCDYCSKTFKSDIALVKHCKLKHNNLDVDESSGGLFIDGINPLTSKSKDSNEKVVSTGTLNKVKSSKQSKTKPSKSQKSRTKLMKSLQEDEMDGNKLFQENVSIREGCFFCKICNRFSTTTKMRAKSHVLSCGKIKKKGRPKKVLKCLQCTDTFGTKKKLDQHHRKDHACQVYTCSTCQRTFGRRHSYLRHLRVHKEAPKLKCPIGLCEKKFRYKCDLARHIKTHNKVPVKAFDNETLAEETTDYEIDLEESRMGDNLCGKLSVTELSSGGSRTRNYVRNCTSFQNSLGFKSLDDWDQFVEITNAWKLPLAEDDQPGSVQSCIFTNNIGENTVKYAWNNFETPEFASKEIVLSIVHDAVEHACLNDPELTDAELLEITDNTFKGAERDVPDPMREMLLPAVFEVLEIADEKFGEESFGKGNSEQNSVNDESRNGNEAAAGNIENVEAVDLGQSKVEMAKSVPVIPAVELTRKGLNCPHCGVMGIKGMSKLLLHIDRIHSRPFTCTICNVEFIDRYFYDKHTPTCFYFCPVDGCNFKEKRESRLKGHLRGHK